MPRHLLGELTGVGDVYAGEHLLRSTAYRLSLWADAEAPAPADDPTPAAIDGFIDIEGIGEAIVLAGPGTLTLRLEDGRRLAFTLVGTEGRIVGRGGLQKA